MSLCLISIAQKNPAWVEQAFADYSQRCQVPYNIEHHQVSLIKRIPGKEAKAIDKEAQLCLKLLKPKDFVIGLDPTGKSLDSYQFAATIQRHIDQGQRPVFMIGAPEGLAAPVRERCDAFWSLGLLTMPHTLAKVVLAEQLYRAWSIIHQHPYHRQ